MKILLVEDDRKFAQDCIEELLRNNHEASFAPDAVSARRKIADEEYEVVIIDLMLPPSFGVEGLDLLKLLKLQKRHIPTIMITYRAFRTTNIVSEAMKLGAGDFIDKDELLFMERLLAAIQDIQSPSTGVHNERAFRPFIGYLVAFIVVSSFCLLVAYILRDFNVTNIVVLSGFLFLCLLALVFVVASGFLETGKIDKHQWYRIVTDKVLSGPIALVKSLLQRNPERDEQSTNKNKESDNGNLGQRDC